MKDLIRFGFQSEIAATRIAPMFIFFAGHIGALGDGAWPPYKRYAIILLRICYANVL